LHAKKTKESIQRDGEKMLAQQTIPIKSRVSSIIVLADSKKIKEISLQSSLSILHLFSIIKRTSTSSNKKSGDENSNEIAIFTS